MQTKPKHGIFFCLILAVLLCACLPHSAEHAAPAAIAMPDEYSADAAEAILRSGGNAIDAAVTAAFVLAVTYPEAGNLGGGGFMMLYHNGQSSFLDYREVAPAAASRDMYLDESGHPIENLSLYGHKAAGVPGTVAGLYEAHRRYGSLPWARLLEASIRLADEGFVMSAQLAGRVHDEMSVFAGRTNFGRYFSAVRAGEVFRQTELAATLRRIAVSGRDGFYRGETARLIGAEMRRGGGLIDAADLNAYTTVWREPLSARWRGYQVLGAPPPSSGGFAVLQLLRMKEYLHAEFAGLAHNSPQYIHLVAEMEKRVFADRAEYLGDPAFVDVPMRRLIDDAYIRMRAEEVDPRSISKLDNVRPGLAEGHSTTHFSIVDQHGNAVANTYTLNTWFGSGVVAEGSGVLLNNQMDDFSVKPGVANFYGVVGKSANAVAPGKRMLSSMSPTILLRDGKVAVVVGTPGGSTIFTSVFQTIVNVAEFGMTPAEAVAATRFHHQLLPPDLVTYSPSRPLPDATIEALQERGYRVEPHFFKFGDVQMIWRQTDGRYLTGADPRGRGVSRWFY